MTTQQLDPDDRVVPELELCDRMRRSMRLVPGMDTTDVGEFMGVRRETVSTWLTGKRTPSYATLVLWADMTGVDQGWLIEGDGYAMRDLNPQPADYGSVTPLRRVEGCQVLAFAPRRSAVKARFTPDRLGA